MTAFFKKEVLLALRRYRWLLLGLVFLVFGIESPLMAKLLPTLLQSALGTQLAGRLPASTSVTAWEQLFKNLTQLGMYSLALVTSGSIARELAAGTLVNLVTKGLPRPSVVLVKYGLAVLEWWVCMTLAALVCWGYTAYYFPDALSPHPLAALVPVLGFGLFFMALVIFGSSLSRSSLVGFGLAAGGQLGLTLVNWFKPARRFNPVSLITDNLAILQGDKALPSLWPAGLVTVVAAACLVAAAVWVLNRKQL